MSLECPTTSSGQFGLWTLNGPQVVAWGFDTLVAGWWRPETLGASKKFWSSGTVTCLRLNQDSATFPNGIELVVDFTTTDKLQETNNASGVQTNEWVFLACYIHTRFTTAQSASGRLWKGTETINPTYKHVREDYLGFNSANTQSGNLVEGSDFRILDSGSFDCQAARVWAITTTTDTSLAAQAQMHLEERFVVPIWEGTFDPQRMTTRLDGNALTASDRGAVRYFPLDSAFQVGANTCFAGYEWQIGNTTAGVAGATVLSSSTSQNVSFSQLEPACPGRFYPSTSSQPQRPLLLGM